MTIAAGFHCADGIVICADTEQTDFIGKYQRTKVFNFENKLFLTGAGTSDYIKMAFDKPCDEYRSAQPVDPSDARDFVERTITELHNQHIFSYYKPVDQSRPTIDLVIAMRCSNGEPVMVKTTDTATILGGFFESVGVGKPLFEYWAQLLYHPKLSIGIAAYLCSFILGQVKENVSGCGGFTFVTALPKDSTRTPNWQFLPDGAIFAGFPRTIAPLLVNCLDFNVSDADFEQMIKTFNAGIWMVRQNDRIRRNSMDIMKYGVMPDMPLGSEEASKALAELIEKKKAETDT